jgi:hypothetical protein
MSTLIKLYSLLLVLFHQALFASSNCSSLQFENPLLLNSYSELISIQNNLAIKPLSKQVKSYNLGPFSSVFPDSEILLISHLEDEVRGPGFSDQYVVPSSSFGTCKSLTPKTIYQVDQVARVTGTEGQNTATRIIVSRIHFSNLAPSSSNPTGACLAKRVSACIVAEYFSSKERVSF